VDFASLQASILSRLYNRRFWRDSGLLMLANVIVTGLALVRTPALTWMVPKEEVGIIGVVASWLPYLQLLSLSGLDLASYHYIAKGQAWAFVVNLVYRLRWSLLSTAGFLVGAAYWWWRGEFLLAWVFVIAGLSYPVTAGLTASARMLGAQENFIGLFWYRLGDSLTHFAGFIPLVLSAWWISRAVTFYAVNQLATAVMQIIVSLWLLWRLRQARVPRMPAEDAREMVRYGRHLTAISGISVAQSRTDALLVGALLPLETMADYSVALVVQTPFRQLWDVYLSVRYPPLVKLSAPRRQRRLLAECAVVWLGFIGVGFVMSIGAHWLIPLLLPPNYSSSLEYINWLIAIVLIGIPGGFAEAYFRMEQDEKRQYLMRVVAAVAGVIFPALLVFTYGVYGVMGGRFVGNLLFSILGAGMFLYEVRRGSA